MFETVNTAEGIFWIVIGAAMAVGALKDRRKRKLAMTAAIAFVVFGVSDFVEVRTGAWWRPWWLLLWKGASVVCLVGCFVAYRSE